MNGTMTAEQMRTQTLDNAADIMRAALENGTGWTSAYSVRQWLLELAAAERTSAHPMSSVRAHALEEAAGKASAALSDEVSGHLRLTKACYWLRRLAFRSDNMASA